MSLLGAPQIALAQDAPASAPVTVCAEGEPCVVAIAAAAPPAAPAPSPAVAPPRGVLLPLYGSFAGFQALDVASSLRARARGGAEANPLLAGVSNPVALTVVKAGATVTTIYLIDRVRKTHRRTAIVTMISLDALYAFVVVHNYRAVH